MSNSAPAPMSLREYAKRRGVSAMAVSKAVKSGRLTASVVRDGHGQPKIADPDLADREWDAGTDHSKAPGYVKERSSTRASPDAPTAPRPAPRPRLAGAPPGTDDGDTAAPDDLSLAEESAREKFWKANLAELDFRKRSGELIEAREWEAKITDVFTRVRVRLLGLPTRAKQQLPELTTQHIAVIDELVREALEELAVDLEHDDDAAPEQEAASA